MKKSELVSSVAKKLSVTKAEASRRIEDVDAIIEVIAAELETGDKAKIGNYIAVEKKEVAERMARNPKTGESVVVPARVAIKVKHTAAAKNL